MSSAGTLPRPVGFPGTGAGIGGRLAGLPGAVLGAAMAAGAQDAIRATKQTRIGECTKAEQHDKNSDCNKCHPANGQKAASTNRYVTDSNRINYEYQLYIANLHASAKHRFGWASGVPEEWLYKNTEFDGFWEDQCTLVEAKGRYKQFLKPNGAQRDFAKHIFEGFNAQAARQLQAAAPLPPAWLKWFCMEAEVAACVQKIFFDSFLPVIVEYHPLPGV